MRSPQSGFSFSSTGPCTPEMYTLSLHDALPILAQPQRELAAGMRIVSHWPFGQGDVPEVYLPHWRDGQKRRSEEHTSELQSRQYLVCRLLLEKKKRHESLVLRPALGRLVSRPAA